MAGYLHPGKAPIFPATRLVCICDVHVPAYRRQSYYILCVSPAVDLLSRNPQPLEIYLDDHPLTTSYWNTTAPLFSRIH